MFTRVAKARHLLDTETHNKKQTFCLLQTCSCLLISEYYITSTPVHLLTYLGSMQEIFLGEVGQCVSWLNVHGHHLGTYIGERLTSQHVCTRTRKSKSKAYGSCEKACNYCHPANHASTNEILRHLSLLQFNSPGAIYL